MLQESHQNPLQLLINVIFVSEPDKIQQSGVRPVGFSDHMSIFCTRKLCILKIGEHVKMRSLKNYDKKYLTIVCLL